MLRWWEGMFRIFDNEWSCFTHRNARKFNEKYKVIRMHSSRMRTPSSSSRLRGGLHQAPPGTDPPTPLGPGTPWDQIPLDQAPPWNRHTPRDQAHTPPPCGQNDRCKHITLPQTSFADGNNNKTIFDSYLSRFRQFFSILILTVGWFA